MALPFVVCYIISRMGFVLTGKCKSLDELEGPFEKRIWSNGQIEE